MYTRKFMYDIFFLHRYMNEFAGNFEKNNILVVCMASYFIST